MMSHYAVLDHKLNPTLPTLMLGVGSPWVSIP